MLILFDFDGTLADTAPDLAFAANLQRARRGLPDLDARLYRQHASHGARGMLHIALGLTPEDADYEATRTLFLQDYARHMTRATRLFPGIAQLLQTLRAHDHVWGIVTNKAKRLALPIIAHLGLAADCVVTVCGDTTAHAKPHPEPLLYAASTTGYAPGACIYIGDDARDVTAGRAAGMPTIAAAYGYCDVGSIPSWGADHVAQTPDDLWPLLRQMSSQQTSGVTHDFP